MQNFSLRKLELSFDFISKGNFGYSNRINGDAVCVQDDIILILILINISLFLQERSFITVGLTKRTNFIMYFFLCFSCVLGLTPFWGQYLLESSVLCTSGLCIMAGALRYCINEPV